MPSRSDLGARTGILAAAALLAAAAFVCSACGGKDSKKPATERPTEPIVKGHYTVLAASAQVFERPGGAEVERLRFGQELSGADEIRGWVRFKGDSGERFVARNLVESDAERISRQRSTEDILALPPIPAVATKDVAMTWGPSFDSPPIGVLAKGSRVKVYTAEGEAWAIELAEPGGARRYVAYVPNDSLLWEGGVVPTSQPGNVATLSVQTIENDPNAALQDPEASASAAPVPLGDPSAFAPEQARPAELVSRVEPIYPLSARRMGIGGTVRLEITIDERGGIADVRVIEDPREDLTEAAISAVRLWRYRPAEEAGRAVRSKKQVEVTFEP